MSDSQASSNRAPCLKARLPDGRQLVITPPDGVPIGELASKCTASFIGSDGVAGVPQAAELHQLYDGNLKFVLADGSAAYFARKPSPGREPISFSLFSATGKALDGERMIVIESEYPHLFVG